MPIDNPSAAHKKAHESIQNGNLALADKICRDIIRSGHRNADTDYLLGLIALKLDLPETAIEYLERSVQTDRPQPAVRETLQFAHTRKKSAAEQTGPTGTPKRFLLIKAWGCGFWADMDHVIGQLLLADLSGRIPVVHWGNNSLFRDTDSDNAFETFFQPVSGYSLQDLSNDCYSYFPPKWSSKNLADNDLNKWKGQYSKAFSLYFLNRPEDVAVGDFYTSLDDLFPWAANTPPFNDMNSQQAYRYLIDKYIRLKPEIAVEIDTFWTTHMKGKQMLAVHIRGGDKEYEQTDLAQVNVTYERAIDDYLAGHPEAAIFLLTDSAEMLAKLKSKYRNKVIHTDCARTETDQGVHYQQHASRSQIGKEVIRDVYLAARCDHFIGNGRSTVSSSVLHLKEWSTIAFQLFGKNHIFSIDYSLHRSTHES